MTASGLAVLATSYSPTERGRALGVYSAVASLSFVVGPLLGGLLTDLSGWRAVFLANVPVAAFSGVAAMAAALAAAGAVVAALTIRPTTARGAPRSRGQHG